MLSELFYWILNISIIGSITGLIVLSLRKIKTLPRFVVYVLWVLPLIRLWLPFGIANEYSLLNLISRFTTKTVVIWEELDFTSAFNLNFSSNGKSVKSFLVDKNGVFWLDGKTQCYKVSSGIFDYQHLKAIFEDSR